MAWGVVVKLIVVTVVLAFVGAALPSQAQAAVTYYELNIPREPLDRALKQFAEQTGLQVARFSDVAEGSSEAGPVVGHFTTEEALQSLLAGSGLSYRILRHRTIAIVRTQPDGSAGAGGSLPAAGETQQRDDQKAQRSFSDPPFLMAQADKGPAAGTAAGEPAEANLPSGSTKQSTSVLQEVIVTGTHIRGVAATSPTVVISREDIERSGYSTVGDLIRSLPDNFGGGNNPQTLIGSAPGIDNASPSGGSAPNLRGLGSGSTLTLVDGHRLAAETINGAIDASMIPLSAIDHIDVVEDGASAIYGSDAVGGVVNIVLKKNFNGAQTTLLGGGTADGGATERNVNQLLGKSWGSGGLIFNYEYDETTPVLAAERDFAATAYAGTTLLPDAGRSSFYLGANQDLSDRVSASVESLYTSRTTHDAYSYGGGAPEFDDLDVHQYVVAPTLDIDLGSRWQMSVFGDFAEQRTINSSSLPSLGVNTGLAYEGFTRYLEATANGPVVSLPTGSVRAALGGGYRAERYTEASGGGSYPYSNVTGKREVKYAYGELNIPLMTASDEPWRGGLQLDVSGRAEHYSDFGDKAVPKLGLLYTPFESIKLRATWGRAFRAPPLFDLFNPLSLLYLPLPDPTSPSGETNVLYEDGGNPNLRPETATTWTAGFDYDPPTIKGLSVNVSYFDINYHNRIDILTNYLTALSDPLEAPFVIRAPSEAYVDSLISRSPGGVYNFTSSPFDPGDVAAVVNDSETNFSAEDAAGVDLGIKYHKAMGAGEIALFADGTYLDLRQRFVSLAPETEVSGEVFEPAKVRARGGATWSERPWSITGIINYTGAETNTYQPDLPHIASATTMDFRIGFGPEAPHFPRGFSAGLSVENAFNRDPPYVKFDQLIPGVHYDPTNASALGRVIRASASYLLQ
jgi:iron complex outermembrane recepter protein